MFDKQKKQLDKRIFDGIPPKTRLKIKKISETITDWVRNAVFFVISAWYFNKLYDTIGNRVFIILFLIIILLIQESLKKKKR
jgi:hypothetical protein